MSCQAKPTMITIIAPQRCLACTREAFQGLSCMTILENRKNNENKMYDDDMRLSWIITIS